MSVSEPGKIITPWAESGLKNTIPPAANPATGRAGFDQGFSAINMTAKEAGGIPPFGQDFNGIFYEVTNILRYMQAGGQPTFDAALATAIGGYPKGAMVLGSDGASVYKNIVDSNSSNPNSGGSGWVREDLILREALRRSYAEAGYNLVNGSFEVGGTLVNANDVLLHEASGKAFSGPAGNVSAGTNPTLPSSGYVPRADVLLRNELAAAGGAGLVGFQQSGTGAVERAANSKLREIVSVKDFGAIGNGISDDTDAVQSAINYGTAVYFPAGVYLVTSTINIPQKACSLNGSGVSTTKILFDPTAPMALFSYTKDHSTSDILTVSDLTLTTETAGIATAIKVDAVLTAEPKQVNGARDTCILNNVFISSVNGYWLTGWHIINSGGNHSYNLKIINNPVAQSVPAVVGIKMETTDNRVSIIRGLTSVDSYIQRTYRAMHFEPGFDVRGIESIYLWGGEIVGCDTAIYTARNTGAITIQGIHFDVINKCIDTLNGLTSFLRVIGCDMRKSENGGVRSSGYIVSHGGGEMITYSGCTFTGHETFTQNPTNGAFQFSNAEGLGRMAVSGCVFRDLNHVYGSTPRSKNVVTSGNSYIYISGSVYLDSNTDNSIVKHDSGVSGTLIVPLGATGDENINVPLSGIIFYPNQYSVAVPVIQSNTGTDKLTIEYMFDPSTNVNLVFRIRGNTTPRNVRIGYTTFPTNFMAAT